MLALGIAIGTYWHDFFAGYLLILIVVAAVSLAYVTYVWWKQQIEGSDSLSELPPDLFSYQPRQLF